MGHKAFSRRVPLLDTTFDKESTTTEEILQRLTIMAQNYWQPDGKKIMELQHVQETLIMDYLQHYMWDSNKAWPSSGRPSGCQDIDDIDLLGINGAKNSLMLSKQKHLLEHALAELYPDISIALGFVSRKWSYQTP